MTERTLRQDLWRWMWIGVAFSVGITTVSLAAMGLMWAFTDRFNPSHEIVGLEIVENSLIETTNGVRIVGKVRNGTDKAKRRIDLRVTFLDTQGKVLDVYEGEVGAIVAPGDEVAFKIQCGSSKIPLTEFAKYELVISGSWSN